MKFLGIHRDRKAEGLQYICTGQKRANTARDILKIFYIIGRKTRNNNLQTQSMIHLHSKPHI